MRYITQRNYNYTYYAISSVCQYEFSLCRAFRWSAIFRLVIWCNIKCNTRFSLLFCSVLVLLSIFTEINVKKTYQFKTRCKDDMVISDI